MLDVQPPYAFLIDLDAAETLDEDQRTEQHLHQLKELLIEVLRLENSMKAAGQINLAEVSEASCLLHAFASHPTSCRS